MFRNDTGNRHGIRPDGIRFIHMEFYGCVIHGNSFLQHGEIIYAAVFYTVIISKSYIRCSQRLTIGEFYIITYRNRPGQSVRADGIICGQIILNLQFLSCSSQCALDQRFMYMLTGAPAVCRIESGLWFGCLGHCYHHFCFGFRSFCFGYCFRCGRCCRRLNSGRLRCLGRGTFYRCF